MSEVSERMQQIEKKLVKVSATLAGLKSQNAQLQQELATAKMRIGSQDSQITALKAENERIQLAKSVVTASGDKAQMKFKVNEMVKEIDKCIALLNR